MVELSEVQKRKLGSHEVAVGGSKGKGDRRDARSCEKPIIVGASRRQRAAMRRTGCKESRARPHEATLDELRFADMSAKLDEGGAAQTAALAQLRGHVQEFSLDPAACRVVQKALSVADRSEAALLVTELHGFVRMAVSSPSGNHVIQKVVEVMPMNSVEFISAELADVALDVARHQYGCRVFCRLMEHHSSQDNAGYTGRLFDTVLGDTSALCLHCYGHHVIETALEHGTGNQKHCIAVALRENPVRFAHSRFGSFVLRKAFSFCQFTDQQALANALISDVEHFVSLLDNQNGCFVVKALLRLPVECLQPALSLVQGQRQPDNVHKKAQRLWREFQEYGVRN